MFLQCIRDWQESRFHATSHRFGCDVSCQKGYYLADHAIEKYVAYSNTTVDIYLHIHHIIPFCYIQVNCFLYTKRANIHCQDTDPLHGNNLAAMNWTNRHIVKTTPPFISSNNEVEKRTWGKTAKRPLVKSNFMKCLHWGKWRGFDDTTEPCIWRPHCI